MEERYHKTNTHATAQSRNYRVKAAAEVISFEKAMKERDLSEHQAAREIGVARTTIRDRIKRKSAIDCSPKVVEFFESPEGLAVIHRIILAAQVVITLLSSGGIRLVCLFLKLSGLSHFVASSYGSQHKAIVALEQNLTLFGVLEFRRLCALMKPKKITILEDETFHPQICLVAIEAASGFILLELYADDRSSQTWSQKLNNALGDLPVEIVQATSDEAKALIKHHEKDLQVNHSPDLFHVEHELFKGTSLAIAREVKACMKQVEEAEKYEQHILDSAEVYKKSNGDNDCYISKQVQKDVEEASADVKSAQKELIEMTKRQEDMKEAIRDISKVYHPFDLETGQARNADQVKKDLHNQFERIDEISEQVNLSQNNMDKIDKARRVLPAMIATIAFFHESIKSWVGQWGFSKSAAQFVLELWIPGRYLQLVASRTADAEQRRRLLEAAAHLLPSSEEIATVFSHLLEEDRLLLASTVEQCAQLFQRSSSSVEGRNGYLSLFHHGRHRLTDSKLNALTVIHNYLLVRSDGTTAAERLFGQKPLDVFDWLLERMDYPSRPSKSGLRIAA